MGTRAGEEFGGEDLAEQDVDLDGQTEEGPLQHEKPAQPEEVEGQGVEGSTEQHLQCSQHTDHVDEKQDHEGLLQLEKPEDQEKEFDGQGFEAMEKQRPHCSQHGDTCDEKQGQKDEEEQKWEVLLVNCASVPRGSHAEFLAVAHGRGRITPSGS